MFLIYNCHNSFSSVDIFGSPQKYSDFTPMEKDEAFGLMGHITAHSSSNDTVPCRLVHNIEFSFYYLGNVIEDSLLLECMFTAINGMLLHSL